MATPSRSIPAPKRVRKRPKNSGLGGPIYPYKVHLTEAQLQDLVMAAQLSIPSPKRLKGGCIDDGLGGKICPNEVHLTNAQLQIVHKFHRQNLINVKKARK